MGIPFPSIESKLRNLIAMELPGLAANPKGRASEYYAAAFAVPLKKARRSALIWSALVVGMPCGKLL
jgi:hypothetical protein